MSLTNPELRQAERRDAAFIAIESERNYQDAQQGNSKKHPERALEMEVLNHTDGKALTLGEGILCMQKLLADAIAHWYSPNTYELALHDVRKIAGVATQLLENHGAPPRVTPESNGFKQPA